MHYKAPFWLPGGHLQTIWPSRMSRQHLAYDITYARQRVATLDEDFVDIDWLQASANQTCTKQINPNTLLVLFHGLEGSSQGHYALAFAQAAQAKGWSYAVPHFRGCSGSINLAPRAYHSGDVTEIDWMLKQIKSQHGGPIVAVGISLGGNALMKWAGEVGHEARHTVQAIASISAPLDLWKSGLNLGKGFNRYVYTAMFLKTMKQKALLKHQQFPKLFDLKRVLTAKTLYDFDNAFTAPLHGFANTEDYWKRASAIRKLTEIRVPALLVNARNDPFIPWDSLPKPEQLGPSLDAYQPSTGGHVGFPASKQSAHSLPEQVLAWLSFKSN
jgi:predicted alpha/beta-fold hydrolase